MNISANDSNVYSFLYVIKYIFVNDCFVICVGTSLLCRCDINNWVDINEEDMKLFMAHVIVMGLIRKPNVTKYWSQNPIISTPFFGKYMGQLNFECILSNIHISDNTIASTDPLVKLKPFLDMCDRNFLHVYKSSKNISVDEVSC